MIGFRVPSEIVFWMYDTSGDSLGMKNNFEK